MRPGDSQSRPNRVHLLAHANTLEKDLPQMGFDSIDDFLRFISAARPAPYELTYDPYVFAAREDPEHGGRDDDAQRIRDLQQALNSPETAAIVALSGGGWFLRILRHLDFTPLVNRREPLWALGFSEMTSLLNIVASFECGRSVYWLCPNYLAWKIRPAEAARDALREFWTGIWAWIAPQSADTGIRGQIGTLRDSGFSGTLVRGRVPSGSATFIGGCLSVLAAMLGGPLAQRLDPRGKWLVIEDLKEAPYRVDRYLAALGLAGWFDVIDGVVVGDFHTGDTDDQPAVLELLRWHLSRADVPVVATRSVGHVWPMSPVILNRPVKVLASGDSITFGPQFAQP